MEINYNLNFLKGRIAEHLIKDLFINNGYKVFNFGLEKLHPSLSKDLADNYHKTSTDLRSMPDFVVHNVEKGDLFYLEVKFRADGCFKFDEKYKNYPYKNTWFVVVSPEKIQCMHYKHLIKKNEITQTSRYPLSGVKSFQFIKEILEEYESYARLIFQPFKK